MSKMKRLFNTYKKATLSTLCAAAILALLGTSMVYAAGAVAESSAIGSENAQNFAFVDAGIDPVLAQLVRTEFEHELGQFIYEVEFIADGTEYEYWIKASDGTILKKEVELKEAERKPEPILRPVSEQKPETTPQPTPEQKPEPTPQPTPEQKPETTPQPAQIDLESAKNIALQDAGVAAEAATFTEGKTDYEDGIMVYDIEFFTATHEYDYEIHAGTGAVRERSAEALEVKHNPPANSGNNTTASGNTNYIGIDSAKAIATSKAGLNTSDVTFTKAKMEHDDGITVYEIEFYHGGMEYECTIKAADGAILEYDCEKDD